MWLFYTLFGNFIGSFFSIFNKKIDNPSSFNNLFFMIFIQYIFCIIVCIILYPGFILNISIINLLKVLPVFITGKLGFICYVKAVENGDVSKILPITKLNVLIPIIGGIIFFNEKLTFLQIMLGVIILILGYLLSKKVVDDKTGNIKSLIFALLFSLLNGITQLLKKYFIVDFSDSFFFQFNISIVALIVLSLFFLLSPKISFGKLKNTPQKKYLLLAALSDIICVLMVNYAMITGELSIITIISAGSIMISLLLSRIILKEKITFSQYIMIILLITSILILSLVS